MISTRKVVSGFLAVFLMTLATASAAKPPMGSEGPSPLYSLSKAAPPQWARPLVPDAAEEFLIQVNPAAVANNPSAFLIDLPGHAPLEAVRTNFFDYRADWKSWFGDLRYADNGEAMGSIHIGFHGDRITALVELENGERYRIVGGPEESQRLVRLDTALTPPSCGLEAPTEAAEPPLRRKPRTSQTPPAEKILSCAANARIDVLVVYPSKGTPGLPGYFDLTAGEESALFTFVQNSISIANQVFVNSGINASYNLVGIVPLINQDNAADPPLPSTGLRAALDWLNQERTELANLRNAFGADIVSVYIPFAWQGTANTYDRACGLANLPLSGNTSFASAYGTVFQPLNGRAFSANRDTCGLDDLTLGHEIGHNYGMRHHDDTGTASYLFPWGRGYVFTDTGGVTRATLMGCHCPSGCVAGPFPVCNRIRYFSDPDKTFNGVPIGVRDANGNDTHHNARVACDQVTGYSNFRAQSANTPPTANFTVSCAGRACTFNAGSTTDNAAIPSTNYWWDFGDDTGFKRTGSSYTHTYASAGSRRVHLVVKDSGGQTDVVWGTANPTASYEGYLEPDTNCSAIHGWAWDGTPNDPINVDIYRDSTFVATVPANQFRQDLLNAGKGNGYHAFGYTPTSAWKDGQWHQAGVRYGGTGTSLYWSPVNIICGVTSLTSQVPTDNLDTVGQVYTVANQFSSTHNGRITHLRFYRAVGETGTNVGKLWTNGGVELARATFPATPSSGWVEVALSSPVAITAGTPYRVSVNTNVRQSKTGCGLTPDITNQVLTAHNGYWIAGNGIFPTTESCSNFFVDVKFDL